MALLVINTVQLFFASWLAGCSNCNIWNNNQWTIDEMKC